MIVLNADLHQHPDVALPVFQVTQRGVECDGYCVLGSKEGGRRDIKISHACIIYASFPGRIKPVS